MKIDDKELERMLQAPEAFINRELSWLNFARRVLEMAGDPAVPLLERLKFVGILGMLHDEFFMKRISGLKRQIQKGVKKLSLDGLTPQEELTACRREILVQREILDALLDDELRPRLAEAGYPILDYHELNKKQRKSLASFFAEQVLPTLTPLAVDAEHPFPFISGLGLNLAVHLGAGAKRRFVRLKVPANRARWVEVAGSSGFVPLEQVIANNLDQLFPKAQQIEAHPFRVTRGAEADETRDASFDDDHFRMAPGSIVAQVTHELKVRRFAGEVRLEVADSMPPDTVEWLRAQLALHGDDIYRSHSLIRRADLLAFPVQVAELRHPIHVPVVHARLQHLNGAIGPGIFEEIRRGDILLHHPYHDFESSVLSFLEGAAVDDQVLAIKLTIYRTSSDSPIVRILSEAARRGKQVAVLVEITARFDEAPNIAWGRLLENEGVHVAYGVEKLKTHVKLALVVRDEGDGIRRYVHVGTGNYHTGTARAYEDLGVLSCDPELSADVAAVFNELTSATPFEDYRKLLVAPRFMRQRFIELIRREATHAQEGKPAGIRAKMNQLQDPTIIRELYRASAAGVLISLNVRGLCCLRPGVPGLSENISVYSILGRFLEHGRVYRFENAGAPVVLLGSADWMKRNLNSRVETIMPVSDPELMDEIDRILEVYEEDNSSAWDLVADGSYRRRVPADGEPARPAQQRFMEMLHG